MSKRPDFIIPQDPLFPLQWHLLNTGSLQNAVQGEDINVVPIWPDYTGRGVVIAVGDDGFEASHPDLEKNYKFALSRDLKTNTIGALPVSLSDDDHGTPVAGLIAASHNMIGGVGVAWDSKLIGYRFDFEGSSSQSEFAQLYVSKVKHAIAAGAAISSNSWGIMGDPFDAQELQPSFVAAAREAAASGRNGLGLVTLFAAGNWAEYFINANYDPTDNLPFAITVGASGIDGKVAGYSHPGASVLVVAPGSDNPASIVTTDLQSVYGDNRKSGIAGNYTDTPESAFNGTSAATPIVAGVVALMLEANPLLGYRDVQDILVYSSRRTIYQGDDRAQFNHATNWNGGGLLTGDEFGFGHVDAHNAVRLAETWQKSSTIANLKIINGNVSASTAIIPSGQEKTATASFNENYLLEQVTVSVDLTTTKLEDVTLELISPHGTRSLLIDHPPADRGPLTDNLIYTLSSVRSWGETLKGEWTLRIVNDADDAPVTLKNWSITAYASDANIPSAQIFTDEFKAFANLDSSRKTIHAENGADLNASSTTQNIVFDLSSGASQLGDVAILLTSPEKFRNAFAGDGDDRVIGNASNNLLLGGRGDNVIDGREGDDVAAFIGQRSMYDVETTDQGIQIISKVLSGGGTDLITNIETLKFGDIELPVLSALDETMMVASFYDALFDRAPDVDGFEAWSDALFENAISEKEVALSFTRADEGGVKNLTHEQYITQLYKSALERSPDLGGFEYWTGLLNAGRADRGDVLIAFVQSEEFESTAINLVVSDVAKLGNFWD